MLDMTFSYILCFTWTLRNPHGIIFLHVQLGILKKSYKYSLVIF